MILVFGGTTEGRKAAEVLEESGSPFFYSTKTGEQELSLHHGQRIDGALDAAAMKAFCMENDIRLIVDAAHPFASMLHQTIAQVAQQLDLSVVRFERIYPPRQEDIVWIDDYAELPSILPPHSSLLATTGVQSISKLKPLEVNKGIKVYYRILERESSIASALKQGATKEQLCYYTNPKDIPVKAEAILLKESGTTGGFAEKVEAAKAQGMRIIALKRPAMPAMFITVNGPYGLRRTVEKLLPEFFPLHSGLTTGTCATAATVAAIIQLREEAQPTQLPLPTEVPVELPNGETIMVPIGYGDGYAYCKKEAGDDPDVTNGIEVRAYAKTNPEVLPSGEVGGRPFLHVGAWEIVAGEGIGHFTVPGFDYPPGEPAINKGPREMLRRNLTHPHPLTNGGEPFELHGLTEISPLPSGGAGGRLLLSIPNGAEIARKTFNPRLGIEGGISIIGVSGIVKPFSEEAFIGSIRKCMVVAKASGTSRVVINSGGKSERFVKALYPTLPQQAFVEYGNYIGETLKIASELNISRITLGVMLGKAVKLAAGHLDTHSKKATMDLQFIAQMLKEANISIDLNGITLARELWERIPANQLKDFTQTVIGHCRKHCAPLLPKGELTILLIDDNGQIFGNS